MGAVVMANKKKFSIRYPMLKQEVRPFLIDIGEISSKNRKLTSCNAIAKKLLSMEKYKGIGLRTMNRYLKMAIEYTIERYTFYLLNRTQRDTDPILVVRELPPMTAALREWALERCRRFAQYEKKLLETADDDEWRQYRADVLQSGDWEIFK
jgi:hypothetical protein